MLSRASLNNNVQLRLTCGQAVNGKQAFINLILLLDIICIIQFSDRIDWKKLPHNITACNLSFVFCHIFVFKVIKYTLLIDFVIGLNNVIYNDVLFP